MPPINEAPTLKSLCVGSVPDLIKVHITRAANKIVNKWGKVKVDRPSGLVRNGVNRPRAAPILLTSGRVKEGEEAVFTGEDDFEYEQREQMDQYVLDNIVVDQWGSDAIRTAVNELREWLLGGMVRSLVDKLASAAMEGVEAAMIDKKSEMNQQTTSAGLSRLNMELFVIVNFTDIFYTTSLSFAKIDGMLQPMRNRLYSHLELLTGLEVLLLGSGSSMRVPEFFREHFLKGVGAMTKLCHFSLQCDCFDDLLSVLSENCQKTLKILDVENSWYVTDASIEAISSFQNLLDLNMFGCGLTSEGQAKVLVALPKLVQLRRADFLCDALDWVGEEGDLCLKITEFWSSEEYHFHTVDQMVKTAKFCPNIRKMKFLFSKEHFNHFLPLANFSNVSELDIFGGDFYSDKLLDLLEIVGGKLTRLGLFYIDQLDMKALAMITIYCQKLRSLGINHCGFKKTTAELASEEGEEEGRRREGLGRQEMPVDQLVQPLLDLNEITFLTSDCHEDYIRMLLSKSLNLVTIRLGCHTSITDAAWTQILSVNRLVRLEVLAIAGSSRPDLTIATVEAVMEACPKLREVTDLRQWVGVYQREMEALEGEVRRRNYRLSFGEDPWKKSQESLRRAGLKEKFDKLERDFGGRVMIP